MSYQNIEAIKVLRDIIKTWMGLTDSQVMLGFQKFNIPTPGLYIVLTQVSDQMVSRDSFLQVGPGSVEQEVGQVVAVHEVQIDVMSFDDSARQRRLELMMALQSIYAEEQQEANGMQIARDVEMMIDTSFLEITKFINRFTTRVRITAMTQVVKGNPDYYSDFTKAVPPQLTVNA